MPAVVDTSGTVTLTTTSETVVLSTSFIACQHYLQGHWVGNQIVPDPPIDESTRLYLTGYIAVTTGTNTNSLTARIRRGSTTGGTLVGIAHTFPASAGVNTFVVVAALDDTNTTLGSTPYCLTLQQGAATGNGTVQYATFSGDPYTVPTY